MSETNRKGIGGGYIFVGVVFFAFSAPVAYFVRWLCEYHYDLGGFVSEDERWIMDTLGYRLFRDADAWFWITLTVGMAIGVTLIVRGIGLRRGWW